MYVNPTLFLFIVVSVYVHKFVPSGLIAYMIPFVPPKYKFPLSSIAGEEIILIPPKYTFTIMLLSSTAAGEEIIFVVYFHFIVVQNSQLNVEYRLFELSEPLK